MSVAVSIARRRLEWRLCAFAGILICLLVMVLCAKTTGGGLSSSRLLLWVLTPLVPSLLIVQPLAVGSSLRLRNRLSSNLAADYALILNAVDAAAKQDSGILKEGGRYRRLQLLMAVLWGYGIIAILFIIFFSMGGKNVFVR